MSWDTVQGGVGVVQDVVYHETWELRAMTGDQNTVFCICTHLEVRGRSKHDLYSLLHRCTVVHCSALQFERAVK